MALFAKNFLTSYRKCSLSVCGSPKGRGSDTTLLMSLAVTLLALLPWVRLLFAFLPASSKNPFSRNSMAPAAKTAAFPPSRYFPPRRLRVLSVTPTPKVSPDRVVRRRTTLFRSGIFGSARPSLTWSRRTRFWIRFSIVRALCQNVLALLAEMHLVLSRKNLLKNIKREKRS